MKSLLLYQRPNQDAKDLTQRNLILELRPQGI
jgi:hypothetical protein